MKMISIQDVNQEYKMFCVQEMLRIKYSFGIWFKINTQVFNFLKRNFQLYIKTRKY